jgi:hypothetical protein
MAEMPAAVPPCSAVQLLLPGQPTTGERHRLLLGRDDSTACAPPLHTAPQPTWFSRAVSAALACSAPRIVAPPAGPALGVRMRIDATSALGLFAGCSKHDGWGRNTWPQCIHTSQEAMSDLLSAEKRPVCCGAPESVGFLKQIKAFTGFLLLAMRSLHYATRCSAIKLIFQSRCVHG